MRMRLFLLVVLHALVISFISITHPQAEEDVRNISDYDDYVVVTVPGLFRLSKWLRNCSL